MRKSIRLLVICVVLALAVLLIAACGAKPAASGAAAAPTAGLAPVKASGDVTAEGKVVPQRQASLSLPVSGIVAEVVVKEGDQVQAGQLVLRLNNGQQTAAVAQAQAAVQQAQAQLAQTKSGAREQEIAAAQAALDAAKAQVAKLNEGALPEDVAAAEAALAAARADQQIANEGADPQALIAASADLANAQAAVQQAQAAYDQIKGNPNVGAYPQSLALQQATNNLEAAKARYELLKQGATTAVRAKAAAGVQQAIAGLDKAKATPRPAEQAAADAEVRRAQAQLDLLKAGSRPESVQAGEAAVAAAEADLKRAQAALAGTELHAPFAGTLVTLDVRPGEQIAPATVLAHLADLTAMQVETTNLTEISVDRVKEGAAATLAFDGVPGLELNGKVARIKSFGESRQGDIVYTVVVIPDQQDARLRWNMTAQVTIK
jgi:HlyD family secretion protein